MKLLYLCIGCIAFCLFSSFTSSEACSYAGSNINFVKTQTRKALDESDINKARFHTYKAIKAIQTSTKTFNDCGCKNADTSINESVMHLKDAVHATTLRETKRLLDIALRHTNDAINALERHRTHNVAPVSNDTPIDAATEAENISKEVTDKKQKQSIDNSLLNYKDSLDNIVDSVDCTEAKEFANKIFLRCEQELLKNNLSEVKKYYNLKTKEITAKALGKLGNCVNIKVD